VAEAAGLGRKSLYKALAADGNPRFETVLKVVSALGLRLSTTAVR
jgi:probable addiction module antidote protein